MSADEKAIIDYLTAWTSSFVSGTEIAKRLDKRRFKDDRLWAMPILSEMVRQGYLDTDAFGHFRIKQDEEEDEEDEKRHVSPQILNILKSSGRKFDTIVPDDDKGTSAIPPLSGASKIGSAKRQKGRLIFFAGNWVCVFGSDGPAHGGNF